MHHIFCANLDVHWPPQIQVHGASDHVMCKLCKEAANTQLVSSAYFCSPAPQTIDGAYDQLNMMGEVVANNQM